MPAPTLTRPEQRVPAAVGAAGDERPNDALQHRAKRARRLKARAVAWALGTTIVTAAWIAHEWNANGAFERFAHGGNLGDWNPTLWALVILGWALVVGIMALRVHFEDASARLERTARLKFHAAAWLLGMVLLAPLNRAAGIRGFCTSAGSGPSSW